MGKLLSLISVILLLLLIWNQTSNVNVLKSENVSLQKRIDSVSNENTIYKYENNELGYIIDELIKKDSSNSKIVDSIQENYE